MTNDSTPRPESTTRWVREPGPGQFREGEWRVYVGSDDDWSRLVETGLLPTFVGEAPLPEGESKDGGLSAAIIEALSQRAYEAQFTMIKWGAVGEAARSVLARAVVLGFEAAQAASPLPPAASEPSCQPELTLAAPYPPVGKIAVMGGGDRIEVWPDEGDNPACFTGFLLKDRRTVAEQRVHDCSIPTDLRLNHPSFIDMARQDRVWRFPRPTVARQLEKVWTFDPFKDVQRQPKAAAMLAMLWAEELRAECGRHGLACDRRRTVPVMIADMVWNMTGREICEAVCRQLRQRVFVRADAPLIGEIAA